VYLAQATKYVPSLTQGYHYGNDELIFNATGHMILDVLVNQFLAGYSQSRS